MFSKVISDMLERNSICLYIIDVLLTSCWALTCVKQNDLRHVGTQQYLPVYNRRLAGRPTSCWALTCVKQNGVPDMNGSEPPPRARTSQGDTALASCVSCTVETQVPWHRWCSQDSTHWCIMRCLVIHLAFVLGVAYAVQTPTPPSSVSVRPQLNPKGIAIEIAPPVNDGGSPVTGYDIAYFRTSVGQEGIWLSRAKITCESDQKTELSHHCENLLTASETTWKNDVSTKNYIVFTFPKRSSVSKIRWKYPCKNTNDKVAIKTFQIETSLDRRQWDPVTSLSPHTGYFEGCGNFIEISFDSAFCRHLKLRIYNSHYSGNDDPVYLQEIEFYGENSVQTVSARVTPATSGTTRYVASVADSDMYAYRVEVKACNAQGCSLVRAGSTGSPLPPQAIIFPPPSTAQGAVLYDDYVDGKGFAQVQTAGWSFRERRSGSWGPTPPRQTLAHGWGTLAEEASRYLDTCDTGFVHFFKRGTYGHQDTSNVGQFHSAVGVGTLLRRECKHCTPESHKLVYYKRLTALPSGYSLYDSLTKTFDTAHNVANNDFELYSSYTDARNAENKWQAAAATEALSMGSVLDVAWSKHDGYAKHPPHLLAGQDFHPNHLGCRELHGPFNRATDAAKRTLTLNPSSVEQSIRVKLRLWAVGMMTNANIVVDDLPEDQRQYSSTSGGSASRLDSQTAWTPQDSDPQPHMIIDLEDRESIVYGIQVGGRRDDPKMFTTKLKVAVSDDRTNWAYVDGGDDMDTHLESGSDLQLLKFSTGPVIGRFIRIDLCGHSYQHSLRVGVLRLQSSQSKEAIVITHDTPNEKRSYSSIHSDPWQYSRLETDDKGWHAKTADSHQWMQLDLDKDHHVLGLRLQKRKDAAQYVTRVNVDISSDRNNWDTIMDVATNLQNDDTVRVVMFPRPSKGRYVRIRPKGWSGAICFRADVITAAYRIRDRKNRREHLSTNERVIDAGHVQKVSGILMSTDTPQSIQVKVSVDKVTWTDVNGGAAMAATVLPAAAGATKTTRVDFPGGDVVARFVKIICTGYCGMHLDLRAPAAATPTEFTVYLDNKILARVSRDHFLTCGASTVAVDRRPRESGRIYSSVWNNDEKYRHSMLDGWDAWYPEQTTGENVVVDFGEVRTFTGIIVQGSRTESLCVQQFTIAVSHDKQAWSDVDDGEPFEINHPDPAFDKKHEVHFQTPSRGRYVKVTITKVMTGMQPALRFGLIAESFQGPQWSVYSAPMYSPWSHDRSNKAKMFDGVCYHDIDTVVRVTQDQADFQIESGMLYEPGTDANEGLQWNQREDHGWWGFEQVQVTDVTGNDPNELEFELHPSAGEFENITHFVLEPSELLLSVANTGSKLSRGVDIGHIRCPAQFHVSFDMTVHTANTQSNSQNIFAITHFGYSPSTCERTLAAMHLDTDDALKIVFGCTEAFSSKKSLNGFEGETVHVDLTVANGQISLRIDNRPWVEEVLIRTTVSPSLMCKVWASESYHPSMDGTVTNFAIEEIPLLEHSNIQTSLVLDHSGFEDRNDAISETTTPSTSEYCDYEVMFEFTLAQPTLTRLVEIDSRFSLWTTKDPPGFQVVTPQFDSVVLGKRLEVHRRYNVRFRVVGKAVYLLVNNDVWMHSGILQGDKVCGKTHAVVLASDAGSEGVTVEHVRFEKLQTVIGQSDEAQKMTMHVTPSGKASAVARFISTHYQPARPTCRVRACNRLGCSRNARGERYIPQTPTNITLESMGSNAMQITVKDKHMGSMPLYYALQPPAECWQVKQSLGDTYAPGIHYVQPAGQGRVPVYCDTDAKMHVPCERLSADTNSAHCLASAKSSDLDSCKVHGMNMVVPRTEQHLHELLRQYGFQTPEFYWKTVPGIVSDVEKSMPSVGEVMTSASTSNFRAIDGQQWWLRDKPHTEPNGDYQPQCWLRTNIDQSVVSIPPVKAVVEDYRTIRAFDTVLADDNFETGYGRWTNNCYNYRNWCAGSHIMGGYRNWGGHCQGQYKSVDWHMPVIDPGLYTFSIDVWFIDSWDKESLWIKVNNHDVWSRYHNHDWGPCYVNKCGAKWRDCVITVSKTLYITGNSLTIKVTNNLHGQRKEESMGIDNFKLTHHVEEETINAGWHLRRVAHHTFEDGADHGWTCAEANHNKDATPSCGGWTTICGGNGNRGTLQNIEKTFDVIKNVVYTIELDILAIDSWDSGEYAYLHVDNVQLWSSVNVLGERANMCGSSSTDQRWKGIRKTVTATSNTLRIKVSSNIFGLSNEESLAIDNVKISTFERDGERSEYSDYRTLRAFDTVLADDNFETGYGRWTNNCYNYRNWCAGSHIMGGYRNWGGHCQGQYKSVDWHMPVIDPGLYTFSIDVWFIDSWDKESLWIKVNNHDVWSRYHNHDWGPCYVNKCGAKWRDCVITVSKTLYITGNSLTIKVTNNLHGQRKEESMGIDNFKLTHHVEEETINAGWHLRRVAHHTFEDGADHGWTCAEANHNKDATPSCGGWTTICGGNGNRGTLQNIEKTFDVIKNVVYTIELDILAIDSWDSGEYAYLHVDNVQLWSSVNVLGERANMCGSSSTDQRWKGIRKTVTATSNTLRIKVSSNIFGLSNEESLAIDNVKISTFERDGEPSQYRLSDTFLFSDNQCDDPTDRYVCSSNNDVTTGGNAVRWLTAAPFVTNATAPHVVHADSADSTRYTGMLSACNSFGCSTPATVATQTPAKPIGVTIAKETTKFVLNVSFSRAANGGLPITHIKTVLYSYDTSDGRLHSRVDQISLETNGQNFQEILLDPVVSMNVPTRAEALMCNSIGCSDDWARSSFTDLSNAQSNVQGQVRYSPLHMNVTFDLASVVEDASAGDPEKTIISWSLLSNNKSQSLYVHERGNKEYFGNLTLPYSSMNTVRLSLPFVGALEYAVFCKHCTVYGSSEFCNVEQQILSTKTISKPLPPNGGNRVGVSALARRGLVSITFQQPHFWGSDSIANGRETLVRMYEAGNADPILLDDFYSKSDNWNIDMGGLTECLIRGLSGTKSYAFQVAVKNGDTESPWTDITPHMYPVSTQPEPPFVDVEDVFSTGLTVSVRPTFLNGAPIQEVTVYMYPVVPSCGPAVVNASMPTANVTQNMSTLTVQKVILVEPSKFETQDKYLVVFGGLKKLHHYLFAATVANSQGTSEKGFSCKPANGIVTSPKQCTKSDSTLTTALPQSVLVSTAEGITNSTRRRLSTSNYVYHAIRKSIAANTFENTIFELDAETYVEYGLSFPSLGMALVNKISGPNVDPGQITIDCEGKRCFNFQQGFVPTEIRGMTFVNGVAPPGENGGVMNLDMGVAYSGPLQIINCAFRSNTAASGSGGAIFVMAAPYQMDMQNIEFSMNSAARGGAMYIDSTQLNLTGALLQRNAASMRGGAVAIVGTSKSSTVSLTRINFVGNAAGENGGVIYIESSKVEIVHSYARAYRDAGTLKRQSAGGSGGFLYAKTSELTVSNVTAKETLSSGCSNLTQTMCLPATVLAMAKTWLPTQLHCTSYRRKTACKGYRTSLLVMIRRLPLMSF